VRGDVRRVYTVGRFLQEVRLEAGCGLSDATLRGGPDVGDLVKLLAGQVEDVPRVLRDIRGVDDLGFGTPGGRTTRMTSPASEVQAPSGQRQAVATMTLGWAISLTCSATFERTRLYSFWRPIICST